jgi:hypothetical protein
MEKSIGGKEMKTAKQVFTDEWIATFGNDDVILKELEIVLKHDYIFEAMKAYAREAYNEYIDYWNSYTGENHLSFDEWMDKQEGLE